MIAIGNIGTTEFVVILVIALVVFGPRRLPGIANALGKTLREFRKALNEVKGEIARADVTRDIAKVKRDITSVGEEIMQVDTTTSPQSPAAPIDYSPTDVAAIQPTHEAPESATDRPDDSDAAEDAAAEGPEDRGDQEDADSRDSNDAPGRTG